MAGNRKSGGVNVGLTTRSRRSGGAWTALTIAKRRVAGAWVDLFSTYSVNAPNIFATAPAGTYVAGSTTATVTGGVGPFTYLWSKTTGLAGSTLTNTTSQTVTVTKNTLGLGTQSGVITVVVTDTGAGGATTSDAANVTLENY